MKKILKLALLAATLAASGLIATTADAAVRLTVQQDGANVVATASGTFDQSGSTPIGAPNLTDNYLFPAFNVITLGVADKSIAYDTTGPLAFGSGGVFFPTAATGTSVGIYFGYLIVSGSYVNNSVLSAAATFNNRTLADLGLTPGIYNYTAGANSLVLTIVSPAVAGVPEPATWAMLMIGFGGIGYAMRRKKVVTRTRFA